MCYHCAIPSRNWRALCHPVSNDQGLTDVLGLIGAGFTTSDTSDTTASNAEIGTSAAHLASNAVYGSGLPSGAAFIPAAWVTETVESALEVVTQLDRKLSIAPMLDCTDRYFRYFLRLISRHTLLYTEMVTTGALLHSDPERFLRFDPIERPLALQLGGSEPDDLASCARMGEERGYDEINLNLGCPSDRVQSGRFGARLMAEPKLVADCVRAMREAVAIPVTVKHRIGIDERDSYAELCEFVSTVAQAGCAVFIVHARKAWLKGLSPKENREIPPLRYDIVKQLKRDFPELSIVINGGIKTLELTATLLRDLDGVMIGREVYHNPWILAQADRCIFGNESTESTRHEVLEAYLPFVDRELAAGTALGRITHHILGLFHGVPGARAWRRHISENAHISGAGVDLIREAAARITR